jgi:hypothetical protein
MNSDSSRSLQSDGGLQGTAAHVLEDEGLRERSEASPTAMQDTREVQPPRHRRRRRRRRQGAGAAPYRIAVTYAHNFWDERQQPDLLRTFTVLWADDL